MSAKVQRIAWCVLVLWALSCERPSNAVDQPRIAIDGRFADWPSETRLLADDEYLYARIELPEEVTLQGAPYTVAVLVDADGDESTGGERAIAAAPLDGIGADLALLFTPGAATGGVSVRAISPDDAPKTKNVGHDAVDLLVAPTYASREFELRIARDVVKSPALSQALADGSVRMRIVTLDADKRVLWSSPALSVDLPARADTAVADVPIPARSDATLRVVSWNVLFASPMKNPQPFARVLRALDPDVVLVQEWEQTTADELRAWFDSNVPTEERWHALTSDGWGVAVIARGPLERLVPAFLPRPAEAPPDTFRPDPALRVAAAVVQTRLGALAVASLHLKCCGARGTPQERARVAETAAIQRALARALADLGERAPALRVVGGDLNLVGTREPLEILRRGLGRDGGDLSAAETAVLGDAAIYTWRHAPSRFSAGRLDYLLYDEGAAELVRAFALDSRRLSSQTLATARLEAADSEASDHLVLAIDLRPSSQLSRCTLPGENAGRQIATYSAPPGSGLL